MIVRVSKAHISHELIISAMQEADPRSIDNKGEARAIGAALLSSLPTQTVDELMNFLIEYNDLTTYEQKHVLWREAYAEAEKRAVT